MDNAIKPVLSKFLFPHVDSEDIGWFEVPVEDVLRLEYGGEENKFLMTIKNALIYKFCFIICKLNGDQPWPSGRAGRS